MSFDDAYDRAQLQAMWERMQSAAEDPEKRELVVRGYTDATNGDPCAEPFDSDYLRAYELGLKLRSE